MTAILGKLMAELAEEMFSDIGATTITASAADPSPLSVGDLKETMEAFDTTKQAIKDLPLPVGPRLTDRDVERIEAHGAPPQRPVFNPPHHRQRRIRKKWMKRYRATVYARDLAASISAEYFWNRHVLPRGMALIDGQVYAFEPQAFSSVMMSPWVPEVLR